ncbi:nucleotidyltransferase domain-containing protein [Sciscionella marina]|uniref:nucleotidyltransferase domain-containing protein n=1 Tax=Sciscionella marina TaxID=508770 RepID=UPI000364CB49|nr:nucleotidyltransferase domain-containing protein [Sciscionella marina]
MDENGFLERIAGRLAGLPLVEAVTLGGSRAQGTNRPDSDWDLAIYYRGEFDPEHLRALGWPGEVSELGGWGGGVFNGGAWVQPEGHQVDVHYRDLDVVERELEKAKAGRFHIEPLLFHLAGIPSYLIVGELAINKVLRGELPRPVYPEPLRENAPKVWWGSADLLFTYARANHAPYGRLAQCLGLLAQAASQSAHAALAAHGEWVTNEKTLLARAGLSGIDELFTAAVPGNLTETVDAARALCAETVGL